MTEAHLGVKSVPRNPLLFAILHRMEAVEKIGSGIRRIRDLCREYGAAEPAITVSDSWVTTVFPRAADAAGDEPGSQPESQPESRPESRPESQPESRPESRPESPLESLEWRVLSLLQQTPLSRSEIAARLGLATVSGHLNTVIRALLDDGLIERTIPEKPGSRLQQYKLTRKGKNRLLKSQEGK